VVRDVKALLVDWGGVLTSDLQDAMGSWCETDRIDYPVFQHVLREWLGDSFGEQARVNPVHALERGEIEVPHFEAALARRLRTLDGRPVEPEGLLDRMFAGFRHRPDMHDVVRRVRGAGRKTGLLSNSWGNDYPREGWAELFDVVVISGEVGMRKPEPEIYLHAAAALGVGPPECVFVDDLASNVDGAAAVGMVGVHHRTVDKTVAELESLFGLRLR
jgi:epoxide hydrolase-like predicted phosphatase